MLDDQSLENLLLAQEALLNALAREVHDGLAQDLSVVLFDLAALETGPLSDEQRQKLRRTTTTLRQSVQQVRELATRLACPPCEGEDFTFSLEAMADTLAARLGKPIQGSINFPSVLEPDRARHLYRYIEGILSYYGNQSSVSSVKWELSQANSRGLFALSCDRLLSPCDDLTQTALSVRAHLLNGTVEFSPSQLTLEFPLSSLPAVQARF